MNYYEHHIGDYTVTTMHLTAMEDGMYSRLLRSYYATEKPLPADVILLQKMVRASSKKEKDALFSVLKQFFILTNDGWRQARCDAEIKRFKERQLKAKRSAECRWQAVAAVEAPTQKDLNTDSFRDANAMRTQCSPDTRHHTPDSIHQSPINQYDVGKNDRGGSNRKPPTKKIPDPGSGQGSAASSAASLAASSAALAPAATPAPLPASAPPILPATPVVLAEPVLRDESVVRDEPVAPKRGAAVSPDALALQIRFAALVSKEGGGVAASDCRIRDMVTVGASEKEVIEAIAIARETRKKMSGDRPINAGYVLAILKTLMLKRQLPSPGELTWWKTHEGIDAKGRELNMQAQGSESYECFKARIFKELRKRKEAGTVAASAKVASPDAPADMDGFFSEGAEYAQ